MAVQDQSIPGAQVPERNIVDATADHIMKMINSGQIHVPEGYSVENALKQAWLTLQSVVDKDKKPALTVCTRASIARALLDMIVQGLNPGKKQCYFIVYGDQLTLSRSYFGDIAVAERVMPGIEVVFQVVYTGDKFAYRIERGRKQVTTHEQELGNVRAENIEAAYCEVYSEDGVLVESEVMTFERIKKSWEMSKTYSYNEKENKKGTHQNYTDAMCLRTVIRKVCLKIVNKSNDSELLATMRRVDEATAEIDADTLAAQEAHQERLSIAPEAGLDEIPTVIDTEAREAETVPVAEAAAEEPSKRQELF